MEYVFMVANILPDIKDRLEKDLEAMILILTRRFSDFSGMQIRGNFWCIKRGLAPLL